MEERFVTVGEERVLVVGLMSRQEFLHKLMGNIHPINWTVKVNNESMSQVDLGKQVEEGDSFSVSLLTSQEVKVPSFVTALRPGQRVETIHPQFPSRIGTVDRIREGQCPFPVIVRFHDGQNGQFKWDEVKQVN